MTFLIEQILKNVFSGTVNLYSSRTTNPLIRKDVFSKYFVVKFKNDNFEIPMFAKTKVENTLSRIVTNNTYEPDKVEVVIPLYCNSEIIHRRVFNSMIKTLFMASSFEERVICIEHNSGIIYGNKGILLDKDFNIMFLCTAECKRDVNLFKYTKLKVYVNPLVFQYQDEFLNKQIIKTLIPFYLDTIIDKVSSNYIFLDELSGKVDVLIEDPNKFIYSSTIVKPESFSNNDANDIVLKNIDMVLQ